MHDAAHPPHPPPGARHAPATARNREPIRQVLADHLPPTGRVLEVACGTGEHALHLSTAFPALTWQPTDVDAANLASAAAWRTLGGPNLLEPLPLDVLAPPPELTGQPWQVVWCANMIHIAPWACTSGLVALASGVLGPGGLLVLYGPFRQRGRLEPSNEAFHAMLCHQDPRWGVRDLEAVDALAGGHGLRLKEVVAMPANNRTVIWERG